MKFLTLALFFFTFSPSSHARLLQIIHTNDLHSYFAGYYNNTGGYARVLTKIKQLKAEAAVKGIEVLQVDAGDWGEGTSFFQSDKGADSIRALELLGTEFATVGNHDHLLGGKVLGDQIRRANVKTKFVVANLESTPDMELGDTLLPYADVKRGGIPIRIIGLTTPESYFQYSIAPGRIRSPNPIAEAEGKKAKASGKGLVIALTHLGLSADESLGRNTTSIDLIIGGHSHAKLTKVDWVTNLEKKKVPIVQAWAHGLAVGGLLIDVKEGGALTVVDYKMHEISSPLASDPEMVTFVQNATTKRNEIFDFKFDEEIGHTDTPITGYIRGQSVWRASCWGWHFATAARKAAKSTVGIHVAGFEGVYKPAGPVTVGDVADSFPHVRKYGDGGWEIATINVSAFKLRAIMYWMSRRGYGVTFSGLGYKNESELPDKGYYTVAFPAEVALAIKTSLPGYRHYLQGLKFTSKYYWPVMMDYIKANSPLKCN